MLATTAFVPIHIMPHAEREMDNQKDGNKDQSSTKDSGVADRIAGLNIRIESKVQTQRRPALALALSRWCPWCPWTLIQLERSRTTGTDQKDYGGLYNRREYGTFFLGSPWHGRFQRLLFVGSNQWLNVGTRFRP